MWKRTALRVQQFLMGETPKTGLLHQERQGSKGKKEEKDIEILQMI
ncbi:hypothetical protein [Nostoc sp. FACHB-280]|nr:hypothetical protein [Nostoc sp. FACHB-280]MBD2496163.1 hypothetical protein [Nostoc sp. FACHB-280]